MYINRQKMSQIFPNAIKNMDSQPSVALIVGVTGMAGLSLVEALKNPTAAGSPWTVYGIARRISPVEKKLDRFIQLDILDRTATLQSLTPLACHVTHVFWVTLAERESDDATSAANSAMLVNVLDALTVPSGSCIRHVALQTGTKHYYWGLLPNGLPGPNNTTSHINAYVPFKESSSRNTCTLFYYDLEDILATYSPNLTWTVHRSSIMLGASDRSLYNVLLTLAIYALICKHVRSPFQFPGSMYAWHHLCDASDADLLAEQQIWAGTAARATCSGQAFNCTNGDVFTWRRFWNVLCEIFDVEFLECGPAPDEEWVGRMMKKGEVWDEIVRVNGLAENKLEEVTCFGAVYAIVNFGFQHVSCMNKSREFGFWRSVDTMESVRKWVERLGEMNIIPKV